MITATQDVAVFKVKRSRLLISDNNIQSSDFHAGNHFFRVGVHFFQMSSFGIKEVIF